MTARIRLRGGPRELADALAARGMAADVCGRSVRAWMPGHEDVTVWVAPGWSAAGGRRRRRRVWSWRRGNSSGWRPRADTAGVATGVAALLIQEGAPS